MPQPRDLVDHLPSECRLLVRARCRTTGRCLRLRTDSLHEPTWRFFLTAFAEGPVEILSARPCLNGSEPLLRWE